MASSSSAVKVVLFRAAMLSRICWGLDAPMRTLVTLPSRRIHASAISASVWPRAAAISFRARICASFSSVMTLSFRKRPSVRMRLSSGMPLR